MARRLSYIITPLVIIIAVMLISCTKQHEAVEELEYLADTYDLPPEDYVAVDSLIVDSTYTEPTRAHLGNIVQDYPYTWTESETIPPVLIIIDDFGYASGQLLQDFADLPSEIVFAILPDLPHTQSAGRIAQANGHEVIIHIPMEARGNSIRPGEHYIKTGMPAEEITAMLDSFYEEIPMAIAGNNHMGTTAVADFDVMDTVLDHLNQKGLFFIDSAVSTDRLAYNLAKERSYPTLRRDIFLDVPDSKDTTIASKIESFSRYKGRKEPIVVITHCHNREKLNALRKFITQIQAMGVRLVNLKQAIEEIVS